MLGSSAHKQRIAVDTRFKKSDDDLESEATQLRENPRDGEFRR